MGAAGSGWAEGSREAVLGQILKKDVWNTCLSLLGGGMVLVGGGNDPEIRAGAIPIPHTTGWDPSLGPLSPYNGLGGKGP